MHCQLTSFELVHPGGSTLETFSGGDVEHQEAVDVLDAQPRADVGRQQVGMPVVQRKKRLGKNVQEQSMYTIV